MNGRVANLNGAQRRTTRPSTGRKRVVVIGAGIGGLTAGALLLHAGHSVTVLEAHVYPGGSAGTFYHQGYRFDAGATLAGGFAPGGPHSRLATLLGVEWPVRPVDPAWVVHLPGHETITQWADPAAWESEWQRTFPGSDRLWRTQRRLADVAWEIAAQPFPWPPASAGDVATLAAAVRPTTLRALPYLTRTVADMIPHERPALKTFLDAQLLIAAQTTADEANALYGSAALDLPRRGVNHVHGGIGALAETLVAWIRDHGGVVHFRQQVEGIEVRDGRAVAVHTNKKMSVEADWVLANVTPWALQHLLADDAPPSLRREVDDREATWGAFTLYLGLDASRLPGSAADHHQVIVDADRPLGEGNSVFISLSDPEDESRAPAGKRAATLSTHTEIGPWWQLRDGDDPAAYKARRDAYTERLLGTAERALPGIRDAAELILPGTPVTFEFYIRRPRGMVGGFPQTSLFRARGPHTGIPNLKLVGDSIFPGQSTAGVTLGAMRVAADVITQMNGDPSWIVSTS
ncbi:MAG: NAD(P)/FAD-dependent oxidoreductase [Candidatus Promineifilaceae bacterium]|nr:NAD(P)/FAD-dependent oxidoreductase [Candidatus Promineifilaceae bacterium]